jgi:hypothetical protein
MPSAERFSKTLYSQQYAAVFLVSFGTHVCKFRDAFAMARHHGAKTEKPPAEELGMGNLNGSISQKPCNVLQPRLPKHQLVRPKKKHSWTSSKRKHPCQSTVHQQPWTLATVFAAVRFSFSAGK